VQWSEWSVGLGLGLDKKVLFTSLSSCMPCTAGGVWNALNASSFAARSWSAAFSQRTEDTTGRAYRCSSVWCRCHWSRKIQFCCTALLSLANFIHDMLTCRLMFQVCFNVCSDARSLSHAKKLCYRSANAIFGEIGRTASCNIISRFFYVARKLAR